MSQDHKSEAFKHTTKRITRNTETYSYSRRPIGQVRSRAQTTKRCSLDLALTVLKILAGPSAPRENRLANVHIISWWQVTSTIKVYHSAFVQNGLESRALAGRAPRLSDVFRGDVRFRLSSPRNLPLTFEKFWVTQIRVSRGAIQIACSAVVSVNPVEKQKKIRQSKRVLPVPEPEGSK